MANTETTVPANPTDPIRSPAMAALTEKLEGLRKNRARMEDVNAYFRKNGTHEGYPGMTAAVAAAADERVWKSPSHEKLPYPSVELRCNGAEIRYAKMRLAEVARAYDAGFSVWEFDGGRAVANTERDRLQLFFGEKPDDRRRALLKSNGFKWEPPREAWERKLSGEAIHAAGLLGFIQPYDGRAGFERPPRPPARDGAVR
jgi:hypothetical protein